MKKYIHYLSITTVSLSLFFIGLSIQVSAQSGYVPSTINDFFMPGSQPLESGTFANPDQCDNCHQDVNKDVTLANEWRGSMMSQAQRDPLYLALLTIANQDAPESGDLCIRCHSPKGWLEGRSEPTDGSALLPDDRESVQCHFCHRTIAPTTVGTNPYPDYPLYTTPSGNDPSTYTLDQTYLATILNIPPVSANGMYIVDDQDNRRAQLFEPQANHAVPYSPFHIESEVCGTCHDVSNPVFDTVMDGLGNIIGYTPNDFNAPPDNFSPYAMFPVERTYSEWLMSEYNTPEGVDSSYFGGNKSFVSTCQDCHMKDITGRGCNKSYAPVRDDLPMHDMTGGNTFIPNLIDSVYPGESDADALAAGVLRARDMLQHAATVELEVEQMEQEVTVKIINETGHKLPSGYPEGRRIWINLKAFNSLTAETYESGYYDPATGILDKIGTKIYEIKPGISPGLAAALGLEAGPSFHFVLNDTIYFDNRIPCRGFTNANFEAIQSQPVGYSYEDGQYWDETEYDLPFIPDSVEVTLYYQTTSKEFVEFLRDENTTNDAGITMYNLWNNNGKSAPELMNYETWSGPPVQSSFTLGLKAYLEGPFNGTEMNTTLNDHNMIPVNQPFNMPPWNYFGDESVPTIPNADIVDWMLLELRETTGDANSALPSAVIEQRAVFLLNNGEIVDIDGFSYPEFNLTISANLFVVLWHRNHLGIMSAVPLTRTGTEYIYDFSVGEGQVHGANLGHTEIGTNIWGMVAADAVADGIIDSIDKINSWMVEAGLSGYHASDMNLDVQTNNVDKNEVFLNNMGKQCQVPD
jgi:hypothetical protein